MFGQPFRNTVTSWNRLISNGLTATSNTEHSVLHMLLSIVMTYIDSGNKKKCLQLLEEIKDIFYYDAGIDILAYNLAN